MRMPHQCLVYFTLKGDFDPNEVTQFLGIEPTGILIKGSRNSNPCYPPISSWEFSSGYIESEILDIYDIASKVINPLTPHADKLKEVMNKFKIEGVLQVALWISSDEEVSNPAIGFDAEVVRFLAAVGASVDIDSYRRSEQ